MGWRVTSVVVGQNVFSVLTLKFIDDCLPFLTLQTRDVINGFGNRWRDKRRRVDTLKIRRWEGQSL